MSALLRSAAFSLTGKILVIYVPLAAVSVAALLGAVASYDYIVGVRQLRQNVAEAAQANAPLLAEALWQFKMAEVLAAARGISSSPSILSVAIYGEDGGLVATAGATDMSSQDIVESRPVYVPVSSLSLDDPQLGVLVVGSSSRIVVDRIIEKWSVALLFLVAMVVALIAATLITTRLVIMRPLRLLEQSIEAGRSGRRVAPVAWSSDDELGRVVAAYNDMIAYKADASEMLKRANEELEERVRARTHELEEARDHAQAATEAKASFLAAMSHEIRTPMNGVVGMVDLLAESELDDDQRKMVGIVKSSAYSLLGIIGDILDFSKLEAGRMKIENVPFSIVDIFESVGVTLWSSALNKGLMMPMFCDPAIPNRVYGDPVRIRQVLTNLIGNAVKFTDSESGRQGKVVVRADLVAEVMDRVRIRFSVADNGIGMDDEMKARLFRPFEQADVSTVRRYGGTGLGLSICKHLMTLMGGEITVESTPDVGSTFSAELWFDAVAGGKPEADLSGLRVLMLLREESGEAGAFLVRYVAHCGGAAEIVHDRDACVQRLRAAAGTADEFDALVVGMRLPRKDKMGFRDSLRTRPGLESLRFVFLDYEHQRTPAVLDSNTVTVTGAPICRATFVQGIAIACGRASPETQSIAQQPSQISKTVAPTVEAARAAGQLILVAEDNETNQEVISRQLAALGHASVVVADGQQALEAYRQGDYALLLTDCHMPVMDGYRLTETIRAGETGTGKRFPIIAITANALHGEAERCLAAGMDDYVVKPIELHAFRRVLRRWMAKAGAPAIPGSDASAGEMAPGPEPTADALSQTGDDARVFDVALVREYLGDDPVLINDILSIFGPSARDTLAEILRGFDAHDAPTVCLAAHKMKSAARTVGAMVLSNLCLALENAADSAEWPAIDAIVPKLDAALNEAIGYIDAHVAEDSNAAA